MSTPNALTYNLYIQQIATMAVLETKTISGVLYGVDDAFNNIIPSMLNYAELRIQRDLNLDALETSNAYTLTASAQGLSIPVADFVTIQTVLVNGTPLLPVTKEFLQNIYPTATALGAPVYFAMYGGDRTTSGNTSMNIIFGPWPDANYPATVTGTTRAPSLLVNATTPLANSGTTWISTFLPDMLVQASMQYISEFQRQFGATSNDPQMPGAYEAAYQALLAGAQGEELRKRWRASAWSAEPTSAAATPGR